MKTQFKETYSADVINYASSTKETKGKDSLSPSEEKVLRKLIQYGRKNSKITYSNQIIANHLFKPNSEQQIGRNIASLKNKGFITTIGIKISNGEDIITRRTININWKKFETIFDSLPNYNTKQDKEATTTPVTDIPELTIELDKEVITTPVIEAEDAPEPTIELVAEIADNIQHTLRMGNGELVDTTKEVHDMYYALSHRKGTMSRLKKIYREYPFLEQIKLSYKEFIASQELTDEANAA